jgi:lysyl-tRNA synthetase class 2
MSDSDHLDDNRLVAERRAKLQRIREQGEAFPNSFRRSALAGQLLAAYDAHSAETLERENVVVSVAGRMLAKRVMGTNSFVNIRDRSGHVQLFVQRELDGDLDPFLEESLKQGL